MPCGNLSLQDLLRLIRRFGVDVSDEVGQPWVPEHLADRQALAGVIPVVVRPRQNSTTVLPCQQARFGVTVQGLVKQV
jgi:hypothetical protein